MKLIKKSSHVLMPWKNLKGVTREIDISPQNADFLKENFLWRLSSASIESDNSFSIFKDYDRLLSIIDEGQLQLNDKTLSPNQVLQFRGEEPISCKILGSKPVQDLGLIYHRHKIHAEMNHYDISNSPLQKKCHALSTYLICTSGEIEVQDICLQELDCLEITQPRTLTIRSIKAPSRFLWIEISPK